MVTPDRSRDWLLLPLVVSATALTACGSSITSDSPRHERTTAVATSATFNTTSVIEPTTGPWARIVDGEIGPGALYRLFIPRTWNGGAIYYAHAIRDVSTPVDLREDIFSAARDLLGAQGYAVAYPSWSLNGFVYKDAVQRVHQMRGILTAELPHPPGRSFLVGFSLGGGVALDVLQTYPNQYDGALLACGMVGGAMVEAQWVGNVRVLFDVFYPGVWPGTAVSTPPNAQPPTLAQLTAAIQAKPTGLDVIASLAQTPLAYNPATNPLDPSSAAFRQLVGSLYRALGLQSGSINQIFELTHGHNAFDNSATVYSIGAHPLLPISQLQPLVDFANANAARYTADPSALNYMERYFTPTGELHIPVLTLHSTWDPTNPTFHEDSLKARVVAAGMTQNLLQRLLTAYGHCDVITTSLQVQSFLDMVNWVTTGVKPAS